MIRSHVLICGGTGCTSSGSAALLSALEEELKIRGLDDEIKVVKTGCFGLCELGPIMIVYPEGTFYSRVTPEVIPEIVEEHLLKGRPVTRLVYDETDVPLPEGQSVSLSDTNFYKKPDVLSSANTAEIQQLVQGSISVDQWAKNIDDKMAAAQ